MQRPLRVLRATGAVAVAGLSWVLADRVTRSALDHRHVLVDGGAAVPHVHGPALLFAAASVLLACLAGVLLVALVSGAGRSGPPRPDPGAPHPGRARRLAAVASGVTLSSVALTEALLHGHAGGALLPHPSLLAAAAVVQAAIGAAGQLLWWWCVDALGVRFRRSVPVRPALPVGPRRWVDRDESAPSSGVVRVLRGRAPPRGVTRLAVPVPTTS